MCAYIRELMRLLHHGERKRERHTQIEGGEMMERRKGREKEEEWRCAP